MTFKELALQEDAKLGFSLRREDEKPFWKGLIDNQSPVMKLWFLVMLCNFIFILVLI